LKIYSNNMKIALANNLYFPFNRGGAETVVKNQINELKKDGHEVFLITCKPKNDSNDRSVLNSEITPDPDLNIYYLESDYSRLAEFSLLRRLAWHIKNTFSFATYATIKKILLNEKPDLVITHNIMGLGFRLPCLLRKLGLRHEHYLHDIQLLYPSGLMMLGQEKIIDSWGAKFYQLFTRAFFASPAKVISPSHWLLGQHRQRGFFHDSETEVKNLIASPSDEEANKINRQSPFRNFLFVGQIENHKGILLLIKSFLSALETKPDMKLTIIGTGSLMNEAKQLTDNNSRINFIGRLEAAGVKDLMTQSDCLIIPSLCYENAPMTIHEAHRAGLAVLAANIGGIPEIISGSDRLFKAGDFLDLKNQLLAK